MAYTQAAINAMNARGKALLDPNKAKPPTPTPAKPTLNGATTLGVGGSRESAYVAPKVSTPWTAPVAKGKTSNEIGGSSSGGSSNTTATEQEAPEWLNLDVDMAGASDFDPIQANNDLVEAQKRARAEALQKQLNNQLSNIEGQYSSIDQNQYNAGNKAAADSDISALNFAQRAASKGIQGNAGSMPEIYRNSALQGRLGEIDNTAMASRNYLDREKLNLQNAYESDLAASDAGIEAQALQNTINQFNLDRDFGLSEAGVTGTYNGQTTLRGQSEMLANRMAQLNIDSQEIQNSYLPETLKLQAEKLKQDVESGRVDINVALAQLAKIKSSGSGSSNRMTFSQALDAWNSNIDTPEIRSILGIQ